VGRVAVLGLVERCRDDLGGRPGAAGGQPLAAGPWPRLRLRWGSGCGGGRFAAATGDDDDDDDDDVARRARTRGEVVDRCQFSHPFPAAFLALGQTGRQLAGPGCPGGRRAQGFGAHHHALAVRGQPPARRPAGPARVGGRRRTPPHRGCSGPGEFLDLALADPGPGRTFDRRRGVGETTRGPPPPLPGAAARGSAYRPPGSAPHRPGTG